MSDSRPAVEESAERLFKVHSTDAAARAAELGQWPEALWQAFERSGLARIALPESRGGGGDWADALALLRVAGRHFVPAPVAETILGLWLLEKAGLPPVEGPLACGPVMSPAPLDLRRSGEEWHVSGAIEVSGGATAGHPLVALALHVNGRCFAVLLDPRHATIDRRVTLAREERSLVCFNGPGVVVAGPLDAISPQHLRAMGAATRVALMTGALESVLGLTVQYANDRQQFGRPLGKFQAVQQQLAVLAGEIAASVMAFEALSQSFGQPLFEIEVAIAKARVSEAAGTGAAIAHQVHGAMGFTHEHSLHLFTKRLWSWRDEYGNEREWQKLLGRFATRAGAASVWNTLTMETV